MKRLTVIGIGLGLVGLLSGCGSQTNSQSSNIHNATTVSTVVNTSSTTNTSSTATVNTSAIGHGSAMVEFAPLTNSKPYEKIPVETQTGKTVYLDANKTPVLFVASWCPHCHALEQGMGEYGVKTKPIMVVTEFRSPFQQTMQQEQQVMKSDHLSGYQVYYLPDAQVGMQYIPGVPTYVANVGGKLQMLSGTVMLPTSDPQFQQYMKQEVQYMFG